jgi:hypothetical protein
MAKKLAESIGWFSEHTTVAGRRPPNVTTVR